MSDQKKSRLGSDPLSWIKPTKEPEEASKALEQLEELAGAGKSRSKAGRPKTIHREITKASQEGLPINWTRATFIVREDLLDRLKGYAYTDRRTIRDIINEAIEQYLDGKEIIERGQD